MWNHIVAASWKQFNHKIEQMFSKDNKTSPVFPAISLTIFVLHISRYFLTNIQGESVHIRPLLSRSTRISWSIVAERIVVFSLLYNLDIETVIIIFVQSEFSLWEFRSYNGVSMWTNMRRRCSMIHTLPRRRKLPLTTTFRKCGTKNGPDDHNWSS